MPGLDGFAVCRAVRSGYRGAILRLTARGEEVDEVLGLAAGADDCRAAQRQRRGLDQPARRLPDADHLAGWDRRRNSVRQVCGRLKFFNGNNGSCPIHHPLLMLPNITLLLYLSA